MVEVIHLFLALDRVGRAVRAEVVQRRTEEDLVVPAHKTRVVAVAVLPEASLASLITAARAVPASSSSATPPVGYVMR